MRRSAIIAWLLPALMLLSGPAWAKLPDWADEVAAAAPELSAEVQHETSRVLLSEVDYTIQSNGRVALRRRLAVQALRPWAQWRLGQGGFVFTSTMKMKSARAWRMDPEGKSRRNWNPPVDVSVGGSFASDTMARVISVDGVRRGSLVFFEFEAVDDPVFMNIWHLFVEDGPILLARMQVEAPLNWTVRSTWLRGGGSDPAVEGDTRTWELHDLPSYPHEPLAPGEADAAPLLVVQAVPREGVDARPVTFGDWSALSLWYERLIEGRDEVTPAIQKATTRAIGDPGRDLLGKIAATGRFVRDSIRYVDIELGIGGWQPHPAEETLDHLYGDCKDKGTLFRAMLSRAGIPSYPVLVNLSHRGMVSDEIPAFLFDHFIVAVPLPPDLDIPESFSGAVADGGDLGPLLIVDTTDERVAIGSLAAELAGKTALVVAGERGRLITLPSDASMHRVERRIRIEISRDGSLALARASRYLGAFAASSRADYMDSAADRKDTIRARVDSVWTGAEMLTYAVEPETEDGSFMETATASLPPPLDRSGTVTIDVFPGAEIDVPRVPLGRRKLPVEYNYPRSIRYEVNLHPIPSEVPLPEAREQSGDGWRVLTSYERKETSVTARLQVDLKRTRFEPADFTELRRFWSALSTAAADTVTLATGYATAGR